MAMADGDYVTLLGDDDGLAPDYFRRLREIVERFDGPELIYTALYQFMHPGAAPWAPEGYVSDLKYAFFFGDHSEPFVLSDAEAHQAVCGSLHLRLNFTYKSQAFASASTAFQAKHQRTGRPLPVPRLLLVMLRSACRALRSSAAPLGAAAAASKLIFGLNLFNGLEGAGASMLNTKLREDRCTEIEQSFRRDQPTR